jgi:hypothetical protein
MVNTEKLKKDPFGIVAPQNFGVFAYPARVVVIVEHAPREARIAELHAIAVTPDVKLFKKEFPGGRENGAQGLPGVFRR